MGEVSRFKPKMLLAVTPCNMIVCHLKAFSVQEEYPFNNKSGRDAQFCWYVGICGEIQIQQHTYYKFLQKCQQQLNTAGLLIKLAVLHIS